MTNKQILKAIRAAGMVAVWDSDTKEFRVTFPQSELPSYERREAVASYCDRDDAINTAHAMRRHFERFGDHG